MEDRSPEIQNAIGAMPFPMLERFVSGLRVNAPMPICTAVTQRLYEVALFDNHVPTEQRISALELLESVKRIVETGWKDHPNAIAAYEVANAAIEDRATRVGVGSLAWLIKENRIASTEELIQFIALPEHAPLLDNFYETVGPEVAVALKAAVTLRVR
jgi:hypothetical protein